MSADGQTRLELTAHPLQRVGAYAVASLGGAESPLEMTGEAFASAIGLMRRDAVAASLVKDTKSDRGFWLKCSLSFFPNSPMNHPANGRKGPVDIREAVTRWRTPPPVEAWPGVACVLCGRDAVRYAGKLDVPLAESDIYRNTTPRGHEGMALCWPCVCCFHALPYGCHQSGGPAVAVHSWDEDFLRQVVVRQVRANLRIIEAGAAAARRLPAQEVVALWALRNYPHRMIDGVELLVFSNNNRGQTLDAHRVDQPLAEWLRRTVHQREGLMVLLRAHTTDKQLGQVGLARNAFRNPPAVLGACTRHLALGAQGGVIRADTGVLADLCFSFVTKVLNMNNNDLDEIKLVAGRVALLLGTETSAGKLREFYSTFRDVRRMRHWLNSRAVQWAAYPPTGADGPMLTMRATDLLFNPDLDGQAWFHRQLFLIAVLEQLHKNGWKPADGKEVAEEIADLATADQKLVEGEEDQ